MNRFLIVSNSLKDKNQEFGKHVQNYIMSKGGQCELCIDAENIPEDIQVDCVIALGGDGTILQVANAVKQAEIPLIGVNLGTVGFMADVEPDNMEDAVDHLMRDEYHIEERMNLTGTIYHEGQIINVANALNDIVISRYGYSRIICFKIYVNGELLDIYEADGVILATPTGSTAYNLSAGGPVVSPKANLILITPVSPHSLTSKSVVCSGDDVIEVEIVRKRKSQTEEVMATYDGGGYMAMEPEDRMKIQCASTKTKLIKLQRKSFYEVLRSKMGDGIR